MQAGVGRTSRFTLPSSWLKVEGMHKRCRGVFRVTGVFVLVAVLPPRN